MASMLLTPFAVNGSCIITLCSVVVQGIQALGTLHLYIHYELLLIPIVHLLASQHCCSTFTKLLTPRHLTFNLICTVSYGSYCTHVHRNLYAFIRYK